MADWPRKADEQNGIAKTLQRIADCLQVNDRKRRRERERRKKREREREEGGREEGGRG